MPFKSLRKAAGFAFGEGGSITTRVLRSGVWVGLSEVGLSILGIVRSVALARLLTPEIFGLMSLAMIVVRAIETFTRPGVAQALIAREGNFAEARDTAFTMLVVRGVLLALALAVAAPWIGRFYESEHLDEMLQLLSFVFLIQSFGNINTVAKQRDLDFRRLTYLTQVTALLGTITTIVVAWIMRNVWALVIGQLVTAGLTAVLSYWFVPGRLRFGFDREIARDLLRYGKFITGSSILLYIATEIDSAVIGKVLGADQLGFYTIAFTIAHIATTNLSKVAAKIMMPAYSKLQSDLPALRKAFLRTVSLVLFAVLPASVGLVVMAEPLIQVVYGTKWLPAAVPLQVLAVFGLFRAMAAFNGYLFEGMGKPKVAFHLALIRLAIVVPLVIPMAKWFGLLGVAAAVTAGMAAQWLAGLPYLYKHLSIRPAQLLAVMWRPVWTAAVMGLLTYVMTVTLDTRSVPGLIVTVGGAAGVFLLLNLRVLLALKRDRAR